MRVLSWDDFVSSYEAGLPMMATVGVFDGLHLGHQALIRAVGSCEAGCRRAVFTFRENPKRLLRPGSYEGDLLSLPNKLELLESLGVEVTVLIDFSGVFSRMPGRNFLSMLWERGRLARIVVGSDFHCGRGRDTDSVALRTFYRELGVEVLVHEPVNLGGRPVSSSRIRAAVAAGELGEVEALLGRPFEVELGSILSREPDGIRYRRPEGMVIPPCGLWPVAGASKATVLLVEEESLMVRGPGFDPARVRVPISVLGKNEEIDKE
jgi:riboflavin kinase/FMN adenylyltransferase